MRVSYTQASVFQPSPHSTTSQYVAINYGSASAAESKHPEYSGSMTHQIGAVQGAAKENASHFSTLQPTRSIWGGQVGVLSMPSSGHYEYYVTVHADPCHHLVVRGHITPFCTWKQQTQGVNASLHPITLYLKM